MTTIALLTCEKLPELHPSDQILIPELAKHNIKTNVELDIKATRTRLQTSTAESTYRWGVGSIVPGGAIGRSLAIVSDLLSMRAAA